MRHRSPTTDVVLAIIVVWAAAFVLQTGLTTGQWVPVLRHTVGLLVMAGLLGYLAAVLDNLLDDMRSGTGRGRGHHVVRIPVKRDTRPRGRRQPPKA